MSNNQPPPHGQDPYGQPPQQYGPGGPGGPYGGPGGGSYGPPPKKSKAGLFAVIAVVLLLIVGGAIALVLTLGNDDDSDDSAKDDESTSESSESASESPSETTDEETTSAGSVTGDGYTYDVPEDWSDVTSEVAAQEPSVDTAIAAGSSIQGSRANIIVESGPAGGETDAESGREAWKNNLEASTGTTPQDIDNGDIGGEDAIGVRIERTNESGVDIVQIGYLTVKDDKIIAVTISTTTDNEDAAMEKFQEVSDSWEWQ